MSQKNRRLIIACGALAREIQQVSELNGWTGTDVQCLPASLHNRPENIPPRVREKIEAQTPHYRQIFVAYADCGTGGLLDAVLAEKGVERLEGAHCYQFYAGSSVFDQLQEAEPGTFYLTDFLVRHFDRLVIKELGLDRHPHLRNTYFGNYSRLLYLSQENLPELAQQARQAADRLGLRYEQLSTGYGELGVQIGQFVDSHPKGDLG